MNSQQTIFNITATVDKDSTLLEKGLSTETSNTSQDEEYLQEDSRSVGSATDICGTSNTSQDEEYPQEDSTLFVVSVGSATDIGGSVENQDDYYTIDTPDFTVLSVIDGHGSSGKMFANNCKQIMQQRIMEKHSELLSDPVTFLEGCFVHLHEKITDDLLLKLDSKGIETQITPQGCVLQKSKYSETWNQVNSGGTTKSVILLIKETLKLYIANVGDSDALLCCSSDILKPSDLHYEKNSIPLLVEEDTSSNILVLTGNHSPNNPTEYTRMRTECPSVTNKLNASAEFIYDNQVKDKTTCSSIFDISETSGKPIVYPHYPWKLLL